MLMSVIEEAMPLRVIRGVGGQAGLDNGSSMRVWAWISSARLPTKKPAWCCNSQNRPRAWMPWPRSRPLGP